MQKFGQWWNIVYLIIYNHKILIFFFTELTKLNKFQPVLTAIHSYFTRWLIGTNSYDLVQIHKIFAKSYVFYELHNSYEFVRMTYT